MSEPLVTSTNSNRAPDDTLLLHLLGALNRFYGGDSTSRRWQNLGTERGPMPRHVGGEHLFFVDLNPYWADDLNDLVRGQARPGNPLQQFVNLLFGL